MGTTVDKEIYLNTTKTLLREALTRAGHYLTEADPFRSYPYALLRDEYSLKLDFLRGEYIAKNWRDGTVSRVGFSSIITFTRGSGGGRHNHLGTFEWVANNVARIDHDPATVATSTSSVVIGAGLKTFAVSRMYPVGQYVRATADASNWVSGRVVASTGTSVTLWVDRVVGTGTFASWTLIRALGLLVEESRTNQQTQSSNVADSAWVKVALTATANVITAPDGTTTGNKLTESAASGQHYAQQGATVSITGGNQYTYSVYAKAGERKGLALAFGAPAFPNVGRRGYFNLETGQVITAEPGVTAAIKDAGGGWYRCSVSAAAVTTGAAVAGYLVMVVDTSGSFASREYVGDGTSGVYVWGAQFEAAAFPTSHIPTTTAQVTRAADLPTVADATDWRSPEGTLILEHDAPATRQLLSSGANLLMTSQGPGKLAVAFTASGSLVCYNGGTPVAGPALTFDTALKLMGGAATFANAHASGLQLIPRALTGAELQRLTS